MNTKESSPFTPGHPVPVELFVGREDQIAEVNRYVKQILSGKQENIFLTGERGMGKSSFAKFLIQLVSTRQNILGLHVFLGGVSTLDEMVRHILEQLLKETGNQPWFDKVKELFGGFIQSVGLFDVSVSFAPPKDRLHGLVRDFPNALRNFLRRLGDEKAGILIALDDINGLARNPEFADWYKSFVDYIGTHYDHFPVAVMLIGVPERRDELSRLQPSLMRVFRMVHVDRLTDREVLGFFTNTFERVGIKIQSEAAKPMARFSSGLPAMMHEIGDATFWLDTDGIIDAKDAVQGIWRAADQIGQKYLEPTFYSSIRSEKYLSILMKWGGLPVSPHFSKHEVETRLDAEERLVFDNLLTKMKKVGVVEPDPEGGRGDWRFANWMYPIYITIESQKRESKKKIG